MNIKGLDKTYETLLHQLTMIEGGVKIPRLGYLDPHPVKYAEFEEFFIYL